MRFNMLNMSTLAERLQQSLDDLGLKAAELARRIHVNKATVSLWLNGTTKRLDGDNLIRAASVLGVEARWLQSGDGPRKRQTGANGIGGRPAHLLPILPWVSAHLYDDETLRASTIEWRHGVTDRESAFYLRANNESHFGDRDLPLNRNALLLIDPDVSVDNIRAAGYAVIAAVRTPAGDNLLRKLVQEGSRTYLHPLNPSYPPEPMPEGTQIIGVVAGLWFDTLPA